MIFPGSSSVPGCRGILHHLVGGSWLIGNAALLTLWRREVSFGHVLRQKDVAVSRKKKIYQKKVLPVGKKSV